MACLQEVQAGELIKIPWIYNEDAALKRCPLCQEDKPLSAFGVHNGKKASADGRQGYCQPCGKLNSQLRLHGMTKAKFFELLADQDYKCLICSKLFDLEDSRNIHIDHDHSCCPEVRSCGECTRGLLCGWCNKLLGFSREDPDILLSAVAYVLAHSKEVVCSAVASE